MLKINPIKLKNITTITYPKKPANTHEKIIQLPPPTPTTLNINPSIPNINKGSSLIVKNDNLNATTNNPTRPPIIIPLTLLFYQNIIYFL